MNAVPATGLPIAPASIKPRTVWWPPPRNVSGAQPTRTPAAVAAASTRSPSATSEPERLFAIGVFVGLYGG